MYAALDKQGNLIHAKDVRKSGCYYRCPKCQQPVRLIKPKQRKAFFRHYYEMRDNPESLEHRQAKAQFMVILNHNQLTASAECALGMMSERRADVYFDYYGRPAAIEFQCASLTQQNLAMRHRSYQALGVTDVWLLGSTYYRLPPAKRALKFCHYHPVWGYYLAYWQCATQRVVLQIHLNFKPPASQLNCLQLSLSLLDYLSQAISFTPQPLVLNRCCLAYDPRAWIAKQLRYRQPRWLALQSVAYEQGWWLQDLPQSLWLPIRLPPVTTEWSVLLIRQIDYFQTNLTINWSIQWQLYQQTEWPLLIN